jgi:hypothetical protein
LETHFEFSRPITSPQEVGMGVHKAGHDHITFSINGVNIRVLYKQIIGRTHVEDMTISYQNGAIGNDAQLTKVRTTLQATRQG